MCGCTGSTQKRLTADRARRREARAAVATRQTKGPGVWNGPRLARRDVGSGER